VGLTSESDVLGQSDHSIWRDNRGVHSTAKPLPQQPCPSEVRPELDRRIYIALRLTRCRRIQARHGADQTFIKLKKFDNPVCVDLPRHIQNEQISWTICKVRNPFISGEHFAMAQPENIPATIIHFLRNEAERLKIARDAARFAEERLDLGQLLLRACC
jgi:hypothetical protein